MNDHGVLSAAIRAENALRELAEVAHQRANTLEAVTKDRNQAMALHTEAIMEREELRAERDAMREHIKNLEAELKQRDCPCGIPQDEPDKGVTINAGEPVFFSPSYAKEAAKSVLGDTLYDAFMRGARAEIIGELQAKDEERFPR